MKQKELITDILSEIEDKEILVYNNTITKDLLHKAMELYFYNNITWTEALNLNSPVTTSREMTKIIKNKDIFNKPRNRPYPYHFLLFLGYKWCPKCKTIKLLQEFNKSNNGVCAPCNREKHRNNKEIENKIKRDNRKKNTKILANHILPKYNMEYKCNACGYDNNYAALDLHRIDTSIDHTSFSKIKNKNSEKLDKFIEIESKNCIVLCANCHTKERSKDDTAQKEIRDALISLGYIWECENIGCNETSHLHLHHKEDKYKNYSFSKFANQSKEKILKDGLLEKEMNKNVSILCGNHHREIHNPEYSKQSIQEIKDENIINTIIN